MARWNARVQVSSWPRSSKSFWQEAVSTVRGTGFGALGANAFRPLGRDLGMPKGSRGGIWAIRPSAGTAQAARPPLLGLLWSGSSRDDNLSLRSPKHGRRARSPECRLRSPKVVDMEQGAAPRYRMVFRISGDGLGRNFLHPLPVKPSPR